MPSPRNLLSPPPKTLEEVPRSASGCHSSINSIIATVMIQTKQPPSPLKKNPKLYRIIRTIALLSEETCRLFSVFPLACKMLLKDCAEKLCRGQRAQS